MTDLLSELIKHIFKNFTVLDFVFFFLLFDKDVKVFMKIPCSARGLLSSDQSRLFPRSDLESTTFRLEI